MYTHTLPFVLRSDAHTGYGYGNVGDDLANALPNAPRPVLRSINGAQHADGMPRAAGAQDTASAGGVPLAELFISCNRSAGLAASVLQQGLLSQGGGTPLGLAYPALARTPDGGILALFSCSGPGNASADGLIAYAAACAALLPPGELEPPDGLQVLQPGRGTIQPAQPAGLALPGAPPSPLSAGWAELSAAGRHRPSGRSFPSVRYARLL